MSASSIAAWSRSGSTQSLGGLFAARLAIPSTLSSEPSNCDSRPTKASSRKSPASCPDILGAIAQFREGLRRDVRNLQLGEHEIAQSVQH